MEIQLIYQDDYFIAVNKPPRMLVRPSYYARNIESPTLVDVLAEQLGEKYHPVHRLDYKTSGVLILSKSPEYVATLQAELESNNIQKKYWALLRGFTEDEGIIESPVKNPDTGVYKEALTHYVTLAKVTVNIPVQPYAQSRYSLVEFIPKTGRMHQLRKHANKISHPIIGDHKYGNRHHNVMFATELELPYFFLHAQSLTFEHPFLGGFLNLKAPLPTFWNKLGEHPDFEGFNAIIKAL